ncbi:hypothetical protein ABIE18_000136 [Arthrobacter sp. 2762]
MAKNIELSQEQIDAAEIAVGNLFKAPAYEDSLLSLHHDYSEDSGPVTLLQVIEAVATAVAVKCE